MVQVGDYGAGWDDGADIKMTVQVEMMVQIRLMV